MSLRLLFTTIVMLGSGCVELATKGHLPASIASERLPLEVCRVDGIEEPLLCGTYRVPENREDSGSRSIDISLVVIPAINPNPDRLAWIEHPGGPRYSTIATAHYFAQGGWLEKFRENVDVVLVDVRGLHQSGPLYCEALKYPRVLSRYYPPDRVRACREELESRFDLGQYSTINAIKDYEEIRQWLGYETWNVGGWSFGSRFMLTYLHLFPDSIRSVSLNVPAILNFRRPLDYARFGQQAFDRLVEECTKNADCHSAFPSFDSDLYTTLDRLEKTPQSIQFPDPNSGEIQQRILTRDVFAETVWVALLDVASTRELPYILHHAARENFDPFVDFVAPKSPPSSEPEGHYFSVVCPEETASLSLEEAEEAAKGTFVGSYIAKDYIEACKAWGAPSSNNHPIEPRIFDIPALIITGESDPVNPPEYGAINAQHFVDPVHITVPLMPHGAGGMENTQCITNLLIKFVEQGSTAGLDTSCIYTIRPPPFRTSD